MNSTFLRRVCLISFVLNVNVSSALELDKLNLPEMGDSAGTLISPQEEKQLGEAFFRGLHQQVDINQDLSLIHI